MTSRWQTFDVESGGWVWGSKDPTATLYHLDVIARERPETVFVTEGEKDADTVMSLGLIAVTSGNAGSWKPHHSEQLKKHGCTLAIVLPHNDLAGDLHAYDVAEKNLDIGLPTKIVRLPGLDEHGDVTDFIEHGGTRDLLLTLIAETAFVRPRDLVQPGSKPKRPRQPQSANYVHPRPLIALFREKLGLSRDVEGQIKTLCPFHLDVNPSLRSTLTDSSGTATPVGSAAGRCSSTSGGKRRSTGRRSRLATHGVVSRRPI